MADFPKFDLLSTPNPEEFVVAVTCEVDNIRLAQMPVSGVTTYEDFEAGDRSRVDEFGAYIFTMASKPGAGLLTFYFAKPKTLAQANAPFLTTTWKGNHRWPPILLFLGFEVDYVRQQSFPVSNGTDVGTGFAPTYYDKSVYIPDVAEGTKFLKDEMLSPVPWDIPQSHVPIATAVQYILPGGGGQSFPECLHPTIHIPDFLTSLTQTIAGSTAAVGGAIEGQNFPATNFETWAPYILSDTQELVNGVWYRTRIRVFPPAQPDPIVRLSR